MIAIAHINCEHDMCCGVDERARNDAARAAQADADRNGNEALNQRDRLIHERLEDCGTFLRPYVEVKVRDRIRADLSTPPTRSEALAAAGFCFAGGLTVTHAWTPTTPFAGMAGALLMLSHVVWPRGLSGEKLASETEECITKEAQALATAWMNRLSLPEVHGDAELTWDNEYLREPEAHAILAEVGQIPPAMTDALRLLDERREDGERAMKAYRAKRSDTAKAG
jgi:hypothetical protein